MKKSVKSLKKRTAKKRIISKTKTGKKISAKKSKTILAKVSIRPQKPDPAHGPGHRKINIFADFPEPSGAKVHLQGSAINNLTKSDKIKRINSNMRRIITGAAIGKTGRIVIK